MRKLFTLYFLVQALHCFSASYLSVWYIADHKEDCGANGKCLLIRNSPDEAWKIFNDTISGFNYEEGYEYCLVVEIDKSIFTNTANQETITATHYKLGELKSKTLTNTTTPKTFANAILPDSSKWLLYKLRMKDGSTRTFSIQKAFLQFNTSNNTFSGNNDCNGISGDFTLIGDSIRFGNISSTLLACSRHSIEPDFMTMLKMATNIKVYKKMLYLTKGKALLGLFTRKL